MLFGVDIKGLVLGAMSGQLNAATLHKRAVTIGDYGQTVATDTDHAAEGVRLAWKSDLALARGYPMDAVKILLLQDGIPDPDLDDHVTIMGARYRIIDRMKDPVDATWTLAGVLAA
jgi:hypothetical protein